MILDGRGLFESWSPPVVVNASLCLAALIYLRGWSRLHSVAPKLISALRLAAFLGGIAGIWIAIGSPLEAFDDTSLTVHMVQHLLLMSVSPPLILLGWPALPLLRGLPNSMARHVVVPISRSNFFRQLADVVTHPGCCWSAAALALIAWHLPGVFDTALRMDWLHELEHASFLITGLLFWWPVVQPWPSTERWPRWSIPLYLFCATFPCDVLSAFLVFCGRVVYSPYLSGGGVFGMSPLQDQECAASLMWVSVTVIFLVPALLVTMHILSPQRSAVPETRGAIPRTADERYLHAPKMEVL
jgi:putative membrane protein